MAHLQYLPGDPRLVDQLVYELKSKGIFDQFRKDCIADVDTRPAYQNLRQRVENSVSTFLSHQCWQPDLNKNQLREKLRKHILDGNYLEQGVERIVDQVVNPKVASVFVPQVEDLVYNYLGITRKKAAPSTNAETSNGKTEDQPTDLDGVSPGSAKSNEDKNERMHTQVKPLQDSSGGKMEVDEEKPKDLKDHSAVEGQANHVDTVKIENETSIVREMVSNDSNSNINSLIPLPTSEAKSEYIPSPSNTPPKTEADKVDLPQQNTVKMEVDKIELPKENNDAMVVELDKIELPKEPNASVSIPLPEENIKDEKDNYFKPVNSDDDESSSDSSLRRNMSPLTPIRNFNNENSCDAQQAFDNDSTEGRNDEKKEPSTFRFAIESKSTENITEAIKTPTPKKQTQDQAGLAYQFNNQININTFNTPTYEESSNSNNLHIDYESDANSKVNQEQKTVEAENSEDCRKEKKVSEKRSSHKSSHRSRDSHKHSSSKEKRSDSKHSTSRDSGRHDKKSSKDDHGKSRSHKESSRDRTDKKDSKEPSRHSSSHRSSHKDSKSHKSSSSSNRHSSKSSDDRKSSSHRDKSEKSSERSSKDKPRDSKSSSRSDRDKKSSSKSKHDEKDKEKKEKKESDDHYSLSGRGNPNRRSTDRDSNDGSSSSKGSHNPPSSKSTDSKKDAKSGSTKSDNMSTGSSTTSPSDRELTLQEKEKEVIDMLQPKPIVRLETHLEMPMASPPHMSFGPDMIMKKPKTLEEALRMRQFLDEERKRMKQEAELLLEFQANVRPSLSQVYSSISGPELEFACVNTNTNSQTQEKSNEALQIYPDEGFSDHVDDYVPSTMTLREVVESIESLNEELNHKAVPHTSEDQISKDTYVANGARNRQKIEKIGSMIESETGGKVKVDKAMQSRNKAIGPKKVKVSNDGKKTTKLFEVTIITEELSENEESIKKNLKKDVKIKSCEKRGKISELSQEQSDLHYFGENEKYTAELEMDRFRRFLKAFTDSTLKSKVHLINCDPYEERIIKEALDGLGRYEIVNYQRNGHLKLPTKPGNIVKDVNLSAEVSLPCDSDVTKTDITNTDIIKPDITETDVTKIDDTKTGATKTDATITDVTKTDVPNTDVTKSDITKPDVTKPNITKADITKPDVTKTDITKTDITKPDITKTEKKPVTEAVFSPVKSDCSFELSSDYDARLEEMVNRTSRQEIMEIILGNVTTDSPTKMPRIDYFTDSKIDSDMENNLKRKYGEVENVNNNRHVLTTPNKMRRLSTDHISSTTEDLDMRSNNNIITNNRSKYLGRAKRVGLSRPRKTDLPNSPSSDKSVENYEHNTPMSHANGKMKSASRNKVQRYDTSDLYKPKLHYLSRRNNIS